MVNTISHFTYDKGDLMHILFDKASKECNKRQNNLKKIQEWNTYNTLKVGISTRVNEI